MATRKLKLTSIHCVDETTQEAIRLIRNESNIRKWMYTDHVISPDEHRNWLATVERNPTITPFVVLDDRNHPLGLVSLNAINRQHKRAEWAYYVTENSPSGVGAIIEYAFIDFAFREFNLEKLNCEVIEGNNAVVKLHKKFLFSEEGFRRSNIEKNGVRIGVHLMGLTKTDWLAGKSSVWNRHSRIFESVDVEIGWPSDIDSPPKPQPA
ncbi:MAG: UDP-4-amino-4,6-dideoxy-N-acetyl-beta-L-altrosamine N-acetyltransferase [bacterium]|nr:UDP-4-amino-4,6-dideoxy-N-acetyl-beta-L-altrosamine N-acetyltransferase [bacterium]